MTTEAEIDHVERPKFNYRQTIVYFLLVLVVCLAFILDNRNQKADEKARCIAGVDIRAVQRETVQQIYVLATSVTERDPNAPPLTDEEILQYNAYIKRVNHFRDETFEKIKPPGLCVPYVNDNNVKPPTPPVEPINTEDRQ